MSRSELALTGLLFTVAMAVAGCGGGGGGGASSLPPAGGGGGGATATPAGTATPGATASPTASPTPTATPTATPSPLVTPAQSSSGVWASIPLNAISASPIQDGIVAKFATGADGDVAPTQSFTTPFSRWENLRTIAADNAGNIYLLDIDNLQQGNLPYIEIFPANANGSMAPSATIGGSNVGIASRSVVEDMAVTPNGGVYLTSGTVGNWTMAYFAPSNRGNVAPTCSSPNQRFYPIRMRYDGYTGNIITFAIDSQTHSDVLAVLQPNNASCVLTTIAYSAPISPATFTFEDLTVDATNAYIIGLYDGPPPSYGFQAFAKSTMTGSPFAITPTTTAQWTSGTSFKGAPIYAAGSIGALPNGTLWLGTSTIIGAGSGPGALMSLSSTASGAPTPSTVVYGSGVNAACLGSASEKPGITAICTDPYSLTNAP